MGILSTNSFPLPGTFSNLPNDLWVPLQLWNRSPVLLCLSSLGSSARQHSLRFNTKSCDLGVCDFKRQRLKTTPDFYVQRISEAATAGKHVSQNALNSPSAKENGLDANGKILSFHIDTNRTDLWWSTVESSWKEKQKLPLLPQILSVGLAKSIPKST